ncbi:hypothetical protein BaRGS_00010578 [Batillaria attramentaria]|uniref:Uncharacterized protein n=1 Tax=Batillaria attramentaria TaxID=370345 RepID=A0ABD0LGS2_9CAEN
MALLAPASMLRTLNLFIPQLRLNINQTSPITCEEIDFSDRQLYLRLKTSSSFAQLATRQRMQQRSSERARPDVSSSPHPNPRSDHSDPHLHPTRSPFLYESSQHTNYLSAKPVEGTSSEGKVESVSITDCTISEGTPTQLSLKAPEGRTGRDGRSALATGNCTARGKTSGRDWTSHGSEVWACTVTDELSRLLAALLAHTEGVTKWRSPRPKVVNALRMREGGPPFRQRAPRATCAALEKCPSMT